MSMQLGQMSPDASQYYPCQVWQSWQSKQDPNPCLEVGTRAGVVSGFSTMRFHADIAEN